MDKGYVLVTGASGGIGLELAKLFANDGYNLILVARSESKLNEIATQLRVAKIKIEVISKDLSIPGAAKSLYDLVLQKNLQVTILVNNAGFGDYGLFSETSWDKELQMLNLNIVALTELTKLFLPKMLANKNGKILNVASTASFMPGPMMSIYFASKAYVLNFSESLASELKGTGVTLTVLCPGPTNTGFEKAADASESGLFKLLPVAKSSDVAKYAYQSLMQGKLVAIHGFINRLVIFLIYISPRKLTAIVIRRILAK